jgi:trimeric autotransporter adhesin
MGNNNVYVGDQAGYNASGSNNTFLGSSAGNVVTAGAQNTMIGSAANVLSPALNRSTALGYGALVGVSDGLVLGDTVNAKIGIGTAYPDQRLTLRGNINFVAFDNSLRLMNEPFLHWDSHQNLALGLGAEIAPGVENALLLGNSLTRVGIGTNAPTARLEIASGREGHSGLRFTDLTARQHPLHTASRFLTVDEQGSVLLARPMVRVDSPDDWADYVFRAEYPLRSLTDLEIFIKEKKHLPGIPSATEMAQQGMEIGPLTGKLVEKIEELSLYLIESDYKYQHLARQYSQVLERLTELESKISAQKLP